MTEHIEICERRSQYTNVRNSVAFINSVLMINGKLRFCDTRLPTHTEQCNPESRYSLRGGLRFVREVYNHVVELNHHIVLERRALIRLSGSFGERRSDNWSIS